MKATMLGAFNCISEGKNSVPSASKPRQLLVLLLLRQGLVQPVETLFDEIWGEELPTSAYTTLQTYVLQIRKLLRRGDFTPGQDIDPKKILQTTSNGYIFQKGHIETDVDEFWKLHQQGMKCYHEKDWQEACLSLERALSLWQGNALVDVPVGPVLRFEVLRLDAAKKAAEQARIDCCIHLGHANQVLPDLQLMSARDPLDESIAGLFMRALYQTSGTYPALAAFDRLRTRLVREIGLEPGPHIRSVRQGILTGAHA